MNEMSGMPHSTSMPDISFMLRMTKCVLYSLNVMFTFSFKFLISKIETDIFLWFLFLVIGTSKKSN